MQLNANKAMPLPAYSYRVYVDNTAYGFAEVSGLNIERETFTYNHGLSWREGQRLQTFHYDHYVPITLKRGVFANEDHLYKWLKDGKERSLRIELLSIDPSTYNTQAQDAFTNDTDISGVDLETVIEWKVEAAVVTKFDGPGLDATSNDVAIDSIEMQAKGISIKYK